ncbi:hypothetical protein [Allochromatium palmeri]|uniref:Methyltransferase FkbM domain-containing protein n=1 Tax=Allochromatium palmeri TaxID=231048 RepID=A0A6N8EG92_9GAMM|nr:hypothetical protein [Allochromatium palmeri]MTW22681.1 hypothetical protein [Allochromatium palmeri]
MSIHTVIHLGSGLCHELDDYLAHDPQHVLLIEADPDTSQQLSQRTAEQSPVEVRCLALAARAGTATLHRYNLPEANSLHPAEGLLQLFPGLRLLETVELETHDVVGVIGALDLDANAEHLLVIELPGEEISVLEALQAADLLRRFRHLRLHGGLEPLYRGSVPAKTLVDWLKTRGFDLVEQDDRDDPDQPYWLFALNPLKLEQAALRKQIETLTTEKAALTKDKTALTSARDEQAKLAAERQTQIETLTTEKAALTKDKTALTNARDEQAKLAAERQKQIEALTAEKAALAKEKTALTSARDEQAKLAAERQKQIEALTAEKAALTKEKTALTSARDEQAKLAAERQTQIETLKTQLQEQQSRVAQLESELAERDQRQALMDEELHKAEGQIELIKDLLLRPDGGL